VHSVSVIIISYNTADITLRCVKETLDELQDLSPQVIIVDNGSEDHTLKLLSELEIDKRIIVARQSENLGYAGAVNAGVMLASGEFLMIMNSDVFIKGSGLKSEFSDVVDLFDSTGVGVVGFQQIFPDGSWQRSNGKFPSISNTVLEALFIPNLANKLKSYLFGKISSRLKDVEYIDGALIFTAKKTFEEIGGFDESYFFYVEEVDFCYSAQRLGWSVKLYPFISVIHIRGESSKAGKVVSDFAVMNSVKSQAIFVAKYHNHNYMKIFLITNIIKYSLYKLLYKILARLTRSEKHEYKRNLFALYKEKWMRYNEK
jgi:GT2 family glycosyltransferase